MVLKSKCNEIRIGIIFILILLFNNFMIIKIIITKIDLIFIKWIYKSKISQHNNQ